METDGFTYPVEMQLEVMAIALRRAKADLKTAQAENARLQTVYNAAAALIRSHVYADSQAGQNACMAELFRVMEALQPAEVSDHDDQPVSE